MSVQEIKEEALKLSSEDREWLAQMLWSTVDARDIPAEEGAEWTRRLQDMESGKVRGIPLEETLARARNEVRKAREAKN